MGEKQDQSQESSGNMDAEEDTRQDTRGGVDSE